MSIAFTAAKGSEASKRVKLVVQRHLVVLHHASEANDELLRGGEFAQLARLRKGKLRGSTRKQVDEKVEVGSVGFVLAEDFVVALGPRGRAIRVEINDVPQVIAFIDAF